MRSSNLARLFCLLLVGILCACGGAQEAADSPAAE